MAGQHVLVISAGADAARLHALVGELASRGIPVVVGPQLGSYPSDSQIGGAVALVLVFGRGDVAATSYPVAQFVAEGMLFVVKFDGDAVVPAELVALGLVDLGPWPQGQGPAFDWLASALATLVRAGESMSTMWSPTVPEAVDSARLSVAQLQTLGDDVGQLAHVFAGDAPQTRLLRETLSEIGATYKVVKDAVECFVAQGLDQDRLDGAAYAKLKHGFLVQAIKNGRGHCHRIGTRYEMVGGLRDGLQGKVSPSTLTRLDSTFARLATADGDLFAAMDHLGQTLTTEAGAIVRYLLTGRTDLARQHVAVAADKLEPLEQTLDTALAAFQEIEISLGYAEPTVPDREATTMEHYEFNVYGNVTGGQFAVGKIKEVQQTIAEASIGEDVKSLLDQLAAATQALAARLPPEDGELVVQELKELTDEFTTGRRRANFVRRAAEGLLNAARKVADVGLPVIELVTKTVALL